MYILANSEQSLFRDDTSDLALAFRVGYLHDVQSLAAVIEKLGNPFIEDREDLLKLDTGDIVDPTVVTVMRQAEETGQQQYETFQKERLVERTKKLMEPIKKIVPLKLRPYGAIQMCILLLLLLLEQTSLFSQPTRKANAKSQVSSLKSDCSLLARMYITCQTRGGNLADFFSHENQACSPSLSNLVNKLRHGTKSDSMECLAF